MVPDPARIVAEFDAKAARYESNRLASWYRAQGQSLLDGLAGQSLPEGEVLDIGCATGWLARELASRHPGRAVLGLDLSPAMIDQARHRLSPASGVPQFFHGDWEGTLPAALSQRRFALITCASTFHYFAAPRQAIRRVYDHLRENGLFVLMERDTTRSPATRLWGCLHRRLIKDKVEFHAAAGLLAMLEQEGFSSPCVRQRIRRWFWHGKLQTSVVILHARKPAHGAPSSTS